MYYILDSHTQQIVKTGKGDLKIYKSRSSANRVVDRNNFIYGASRYYVIFRYEKPETLDTSRSENTALS